MVYAKINEDGSCAGFYDPAFCKPPQGAIEITAEQHREWLQKQSRLVMRAGKLVDAPPPPPPAPAPQGDPAAPRSAAELHQAVKALRDELDALQKQMASIPAGA